MLSLIALTLLSSLVRAQDALLTLSDSEATVYYDLTNSLCGNNDPFLNDWAETSGINNGVPYCEGSTDMSLADLGTNRIVAVNVTMMQGDPSEWCGKEVELVDSSGNTFSFSEGSLFIWDACAAAASSHIVDLSAKAFTELKGGTCGGNNPTGLTINILNSNVWEAGSGGGSASASASSGSGGSGSGSSATAATVPVASSATSSRGPSRTTFASASQSTQTGSAGSGSGAGIGVALAAADSGSAAISASSSASAVASAVASAFTSAAVASAQASSAGFGNTAVTVATAATAASSASSSSSATSGDCTYGAWQCDGLQLQVCNYVSISQLGWETIETCTSTCDVTSTGSIDCE